MDFLWRNPKNLRNCRADGIGYELRMSYATGKNSLDLNYHRMTKLEVERAWTRARRLEPKFYFH